MLGAFLMTGVAAAGARAGWWPAVDAIRTNGWSAALAAAGLLVSVVARFRRGRRGNGLAIAALLLAAIFLSTVANDAVRSANAPGLRDVTTDLAEPPAFAGPLRRDLHEGLPTGKRPGFEALSPLERWRAVHAEAYPDLRPVTLDIPPSEALRRAEQAVADLGWTLRRRSADTVEAEVSHPPIRNARRRRHPGPPSRAGEPHRHPLCPPRGPPRPRPGHPQHSPAGSGAAGALSDTPARP